MCRNRFLYFVVALPVVAAGARIVARADEAGETESVAVVDVGECRVLFVNRVLLPSDRMGILSQVVDEGQWVESGQVVARLQDTVPRSALAVAEARAASDVDVRLAEKEHAQALAEYEAGLAANREAGGNRPAYPETEITRRRLAAEAAELRIKQAERDLEVLERARDQADAELQTYSVKSPIAGIVVRALKEVGEGAQQVEPIVEVVNIDTVRVEGFVPLDDVVHLEVGMPVQIYADLSGPGEPGSVLVPPSRRSEAGPYDGWIGFIDVSIQPVARSVRVWAEVENTDGQLRDGMTARMQIHIEATRLRQPTD